MPLPVKIGTDQTIAHSSPALAETAPWVTALANGEFLVHYSHVFSQGGADLDLHYQRFENFEGAPLQLAGPTGTAGTILIEDQATTERLADGRVIVAWRTEATAGVGDANNIQARIFNADGTVDVGTFDVFAGAGVQRQPAVATSVNGGFAVAWLDESVPDFQVGVKTYDAAGVQTGTLNLSTADGVFRGASLAAEVREVAIVGLSNGNYVVSWSTLNNGHDIRAQILSPTGALIGTDFLVHESVNTDHTPTFTATHDGGFFVSWGGEFGPLGRFYQADGTPAPGGAFQIGTGFATNFGDNSTSSGLLPDGRIMVVWTAGDDVKGRIVNSDGTFDSDVFTVNTVTAGVQGDAQVEVLADGHFVVTWETSADGGHVQYAVFDARNTGVDIAGTARDDVYTGSAFDDTMIGQDGNDRLAGAGGNDHLSGGLGTDTLRGGTGNDWLDGGGGVDTMDGGDGNDVYFANLETDVVSESTASLAIGGDDLVNYSGPTGSLFTLTANIERLTLTGTNGTNGLGNALANTLTGNSAVNVLVGDQGNDVLDGGGGLDTLNGGDDSDTYVLGAENDIVIDSAGIDTITSTISRNLLGYPTIENLVLLNVATALNGVGNNLNNFIAGNNFNNVLSDNIGNDTLSGGLGNDTLVSGAGADRLLGGNGNDTLVGGAGIDTLTGGLNNDFFVFNAPLNAANRDIITDFNHINDTFRLENAFMTKLGAGVHALNPQFFHAGAAAADANDYIVYNRASGALYYDSNGNGAGGAILLATLTNKPVLAANDFTVI